ncbi:MAG: zinc transporter ZntB [Gammaproteobacteria bacterium]|nr:zinc transporter ZntB [Gammaproteobacteria bacterium]NIM74463.1 zinc transporter ZntB [Gammaproteobacteria bacterium]NIO26296.1 zinc transporter ZntB [Gammaproteobacteria bacterium]NIO66848.1 zinc transporter ZntB [Gammaproteobacteria bacterium]NIP45158.1 zinc transporter ZntB [Gammaproteobacteria bacterium]
MTLEQGLIAAYVLDGRGGGKQIGWEAVQTWQPSDGLLWVHLDYRQPDVQAWLREESGIDPVVADSLLLEEVRPRSLSTKQGLMVVLRGVNLNPGQQPEDMVALRFWIEDHRVITLRHRHLLSVDDLRERIDRGLGPVSPGSFLVDLAERLADRMAKPIADVEDAVDRLGEQVATAESRQLRTQLSQVRREAITLRRYLAPQRDAMSRLYSEPVPWLDDTHRMRLRELADRTMRYVEDLDAARERAGVSHEELASLMADQMNNRMYLLSIVAALFLPLGFVTGLLGVNVAGIPGTEYGAAFVLVCVALVVLAVLELWFFKRRGWV